MAPVHHARNDQPVDVSQNFLKRLAFLGPLRRKPRTNCARLLTRRDAQRLDIFTEISNPICQFVQLLPEFLSRGVSEISPSHARSPIAANSHVWGAQAAGL